MAHPNIPDDAVADPPPGTPGVIIPRPLYVVYRYYSCIPWLRVHVRSVQTTVPGWDPATTEIDTANDNPDGQLVTDINHAAYGLYCLRVVVCVPYSQWQRGIYHRFYIRLHYRHPYICWWDHWFYYWRSPRYAFQVQLNGAQEVPANSSPATGSGVIYFDPIYKTLCYDIRYGGLTADYSAAHIHGPAGPGTNAGVLFPLNNIPAGTRAGRLFGVTPPLTSTQEGYLRNNLLYVNIHSVGQFSGGEIRSQIFPSSVAVYCPWRPTWIPLLRWTRGGPVWGLTVTHPYCYPWDPWYRPRPFCLYGLRYYFTPIGSIRQPAPVPYIAQLPTSRSTAVQWIRHPKPIYKYWPYTGYCARWYWWRCTPFGIYRHLPPVVQFATWVNPDINDPPVLQDFPDDPVPEYEGTVGICTLRALVSQQGDLTGDGFENLADLSAFKQEQGTSSQDTVDTDGGPAAR
jgi:hypothetical protein